MVVGSNAHPFRVARANHGLELRPMQPTPRIRKPFSPTIWILLGALALLIAAGAWFKTRDSGATPTNSFDSIAHHYADQLLSFQIALVRDGQRYEPTLEGLRTGILRMRGADAWPTVPDGVTVLERPSKSTFCFAVRHTNGTHWYVVYDDVGTGREMPDSKEPADCP